MADGDTGVGRVAARGSGLSPLGVAAIYLAFGLAALALFDLVVPRVIRSHDLLHRVQAVKGLVEVSVTAGLVYLLVARSRRSLTRTNRELQEAQTRLAVLYRLLRHDLRTDLTLIRGFSERAQEAANRPSAVEACEETVETADEVGRQVSKIHSFRDVIHQRATPSEMPLADVVARAVARIDARFDARGAISVGDLDGIRVRAVPEIEHALTEIVENAVVHHDGDSPTVSIVGRRREGAAVLEVRDDGPGIPDQEATILAAREVETSLKHVSGIGLWLADWTTVESGGTLSIADRRDGRGTTVRVTLPLAAD